MTSPNVEDRAKVERVATLDAVARQSFLRWALPEEAQ